jgi:hypothetical protein
VGTGINAVGPGTNSYNFPGNVTSTSGPKQNFSDIYRELNQTYNDQLSKLAKHPELDEVFYHVDNPLKALGITTQNPQNSNLA